MSKRDELTAELTIALRQFQQATDAMDEAAVRAMGINRTDGRCLDILDIHGEAMTAGELATAASLSPGAVTTVIDRLERAGYARRVTDPADRRRVMVELTPLTRQLTEELYMPMGVEGAKAMKGYSDADLELMRDFLVIGAKIQNDQAARVRERAEGSPTA
jgi:DNA-binding MarR family transcriptional regulator